MWGITGRGARLGEHRRSGRTISTGIARIAVRGPVEHGVLDIGGEFDFSSVDDALDVVAQLPHRIALIDVSGLEFVDTAGARAIEQMQDDRFELHGVRPDIVGASRTIQRTLTLVRSAELLTR